MEDHGFNGLNANPHHYRDMFFPVYAAMDEARQGESSQPTQSSMREQSQRVAQQSTGAYMHTIAISCSKISMTDAYTEQNLDQMVSQDASCVQQDLQLQFPPFMQEDMQQAQQVQQVPEQPPKLQLQLDGSWRQRSSESHAVIFPRKPPR
jgi:hypothetical protein